jgi:glutathione S-transferase
MLLIEAKEIPIHIELVNMRSYGDKPRSFLQKVPNGMLPALEDNRTGNVALDSAYIMEFLEETHPSPTFKRMVPTPQDQPADHKRYRALMGLERELFRWWCTLVFRQEQPNPSGSGGGGNPAAALMGKLLGNAGGGSNDDDDESYVSPSMRAFLECLETVDAQLLSTKGPYFLGYADHPTMIDFVFASHVERMLASCAYWKGMDLRNPTDYPTLNALRTWMEALEKHEYYLAFKSDYYTHVKDIPPQYGPGSPGVSRSNKIRSNSANIEGRGTAWRLPLDDDEALQPLFLGIPLPKCVLEAAGIDADPDGSYLRAGPTTAMQEACLAMAAWKLCGNGPAVAGFAARGGPAGAKNVRKTFGAELADPYAKADDSMVEAVDAVLRKVAETMIDRSSSAGGEANALPGQASAAALVQAAGSKAAGVATSLAYLRDRIGVPRDLPLASARYLRAYLNWAIDVLEGA